MAWDEWARIFEQYPQLVDDEMGEDLREVILRYKLVLDQLDEEFPEDFKLQMLMHIDEDDERGMPSGGPGTSGAPPAGGAPNQ